MGVWEQGEKVADGKLHLGTDMSALQVRGRQLWHRENCSGGVLLGSEIARENTSLHQRREGGSR